MGFQRLKKIAKKITGVLLQNNNFDGQLPAVLAKTGALSIELDTALSQLSMLVERQNETAAARPDLSESTRYRSCLFMILANHRSGSTWLETMLGDLPDVVTDFEFKWDIDYAPHDHHRVLSKQSSTAADILGAIENDAPIAGSKLVFDAQCLSPFQAAAIPASIGEDVRIVHLTRNYRDVFLSRRRGFFHRVREGKVDALGTHLREGLIQATPDASAAMNEAIFAEPESVYEELGIYLANDLYALQLAASAEYLRLDYAEVPSRLEEIADFIGSRATPQEIQRVLDDAPVEKLPPVAPERLVVNLKELDPIFAAFSKLKESVLQPR